MQEGIIIKGIGGFYYVETESKDIFECRARGKFRKKNITPLVGDRVVIEVTDNNSGYIIDIKERRSQLIRPAVSNVDQVVVVFSIKEPYINYTLLDRILVQIEKNKLDTILCFSKSDLVTEEEYNEVSRIYIDAGYKVIKTDVVNNNGIEELKGLLRDKITVFAGPSGVGKSTLFNVLQDKVKMETGEISSKISRGKHTTRHAQLINLEHDSYIVDTPGFSMLDLSHIDEFELMHYFREFKEYLGRCKFSSCLHLNEKGCAIIESVENGLLSRRRYDNYKLFLLEIKNNRRISK
ncbi:putative ribosome biogenesis GTPase RsgA [Caloramator mitchellensis]|uniref:Small ribosomal subunit biogenesis GTPase RsgA n=1 Tax=Caloramator mitchellensis TaxID=908809 RepID=A0A0R3JTR5_CALMK|nr:ribosome small subunit-dependent GTPase A [Caloramator mitchellensis]KRQ86931.1 putative ribosome biogenesis GTPase RsgA [Caloramator mitchellensis]